MTANHTHAGRVRRSWQRVGEVLIALVVAGAAVGGALAPVGGERALRPLDLETLRREALARPNDAELFLLLGRRLRQSGEVRRAFVITNHAYDLNDHSPRFVAAMAGALVDAGDLDSAYPLAVDAVGRWPHSGDVRAQLSRIYVGRGYFSDALREAEAAVRLAPGAPEAWQALGNADALNKRPVEAYAAFERALKLEPHDAGLRADYGEALARYGRPAAAQRMLEEALKLAPRWSRPAALLGEFQASRARTPAERAAARALLERALSRAPRDAEARYNLALLDLRDGRNEEAIRLLNACLTNDPRYGEAYLALGQAYQRQGQSAEARQAFAAWQRFSDQRREEAQLTLRLRRTPGDAALRRRPGTRRRRVGLHAGQGHPARQE